MAYLSIEEVEICVASYFRRRPEEIRAKGRKEPLAWIRGIVMAMVSEYTAFNDAECAMYYGKDRGVVHAARMRVRNRTETCDRDRHDVQQCRRRLDHLSRLASEPTHADLNQTWLVLEGGSGAPVRAKSSA